MVARLRGFVARHSTWQIRSRHCKGNGLSSLNIHQWSEQREQGCGESERSPAELLRETHARRKARVTANERMPLDQHERDCVPIDQQWMMSGEKPNAGRLSCHNAEKRGKHHWLLRQQAAAVDICCRHF